LLPSDSRAGLVVEGLRVDATDSGIDIVADVSFEVAAGEAIGIVGESGSGKTTVAMALLGFSRRGTSVVAGSVFVDGTELLSLDEPSLRAQRGRLISFVPQNPARALSPAMRIGRQVAEMHEIHRGDRGDGSLAAAWQGAQLSYTPEYAARYPHELSGGQMQRVAIAMALVSEPSVIVMDEPTTGLDVNTQARLLDVIRALRSERQTTIVYVSHDLAVVRNLVDRVAVMYGGRVVEEAAVDDLFRAPAHPYTRRLLEAIPRIHHRAASLRGIPGTAVEPWNRPPGCPFAQRCEFRIERCDTEMPPVESIGDARHEVRCWVWRDPAARGVAGGERPPMLAIERLPSVSASQSLLTVRDLHAGYSGRRPSPWRARAWVPAVSGATFEVHAGECLAVVGESGSGKTTLGRCLAGLHAPRSGEMEFGGVRLGWLAREREPAIRRRIQIVFQDPDSSLNPSMTVGSLVQRPLKQFFQLSRREEAARVSELLETIRLPASMASRLPRELSGGEKQRVALARALAAQPDLLICDEVTSALDVAVQANILELLAELRAATGMGIIFITHDLAVVRAISDRVIVMHAGELRETADREELFASPRDTYTRELLAAVPDLRPDDYPHPGGPEVLDVHARNGGER
jgi:peptide/nickel transport system ATP-binding protein